MIALITFILVLVISLIVVRVASVALTLTDMSSEVARFQARSAWTGTGFTTSESESVVGHPVRRRIVTILMVLRGAGLVTAVSALILSFAPAQQDGEQGLIRLAVLFALVIALWLVSASKWVDRHLTRIIRYFLGKWTDLDVRDFAGILHLGGDYSVAELRVQEEDWIAGRMLRDLDLPREGVLVLGIQKPKGGYLGAPRGETKIHARDVLLLYGRSSVLNNLDRREAGIEGQIEHYKAAREHKEREAEEKAQEEAEERESELKEQGKKKTASKSES